MCYVCCEAVADLGGLMLTLDLCEKTEGVDLDLLFRTLARKFYRGFATREDALSFYRTYDVITKGTEMYIAPEDREMIR